MLLMFGRERKLDVIDIEKKLDVIFFLCWILMLPYHVKIYMNRLYYLEGYAIDDNICELRYI